MTTITSSSITGITSVTAGTDVASKQYLEIVGQIPSQSGNSGKFLTTIDGINASWDYVSNYEEFTTIGISTFVPPSQANLLLIEAIGAGSGGNAGTTGGSGGGGGGSGSYTSWYIPREIIFSNLTINIGIGGPGGATDGASGAAGAGTTISWSGSSGTYTVTSNGGEANGVAGIAQTFTSGSFYYTTAGLSGASSGTSASSQTNQYQATGGGGGASGSGNNGGSGGSINVYGITTSASGGTSSGTNGVTGVAITGLPYGYGGGGGGASVSIAATGGNGVRGGGGGGGAANSTSFGNGGNGGDGYVKITWF